MCVQELNQIFGDSDRPATFADTLEMKFLERCLLETLRMYPPVPIIARKLQEDVKLGITVTCITCTYNQFCRLLPQVLFCNRGLGWKSEMLLVLSYANLCMLDSQLCYLENSFQFHYVSTRMGLLSGW